MQNSVAVPSQIPLQNKHQFLIFPSALPRHITDIHLKLTWQDRASSSLTRIYTCSCFFHKWHKSFLRDYKCKANFTQGFCRSHLNSPKIKISLKDYSSFSDWEILWVFLIYRIIRPKTGETLTTVGGLTVIMSWVLNKTGQKSVTNDTGPDVLSDFPSFPSVRTWSKLLIQLTMVSEEGLKKSQF